MTSHALVALEPGRLDSTRLECECGWTRVIPAHLDARRRHRIHALTHETLELDLEGLLPPARTMVDVRSATVNEMFGGA